MFLKILNSYYYASYKDFALSLFPSWKYGMGVSAVSSSAVIAWFASVLGVTPLIVGAMIIVLAVETVTGVKASRKLGKGFESTKFSRCVLKLFVWISLLFALHSFAVDMLHFDGFVYLAASWMFSCFHALMMVYFCIENVTSVLENLAVIDGHNKDEYINAIKDIFSEFVNLLKNNLTRRK